MARPLAFLLVLVGLCSLPHTAQALITGGEGNQPIRDPGWPAGAAAVFNTKARIAWWEGPPLGGGEWHAECRGDTAAFNAVLSDFAKINAPKKRLVVHDGVGRSFWLNPNREEAKADKAKTDWTFVVWQPDRWKQLQSLPPDLRPSVSRPEDTGPVPRIDVYVGFNIRWADVKVPEGIEVIDERLEAHGFRPADGVVLEGRVFDLDTGAPIAAATMRLETVEPQKTGGYRHEQVGTASADAAGRWVLKNAPTGWHRLIVEADGYVPRIAGYGTFDEGPRWTRFETKLSRPAPVAGRVTDDAGQPLAGVVVRLHSVMVASERYETPGEYKFTTDAEGHFRGEQVPKGETRASVHKPGYVRPGLIPPFETPRDDLAFEMTKAARVVVTVNFVDATRPKSYLVNLVPEEGEEVGRWSGSANVNDEGKVTFENIPPGNYVLTGRPNPGSDAEQTNPIVLNLEPGKTTDASLDPK